MIILGAFIGLLVFVLYFSIFHLVMRKLGEELLYIDNPIPTVLFMVVLVSLFIGGYFQFELNEITFSYLFYIPFAALAFFSLSCLFAAVWNNFEIKNNLDPLGLEAKDKRELK